MKQLYDFKPGDYFSSKKYLNIVIANDTEGVTFYVIDRYPRYTSSISSGIATYVITTDSEWPDYEYFPVKPHVIN